METPSDLLSDLNAEQKQAVTHGEGPLLIVAGAGTGKTTVITRRIAWLIHSGKCKPEEILALTFTEKASGEMEERVDRLLPYGYVNLWIFTFHAFCQRILEQHGLDIGIPNSFKLFDTTAAWLLVRKNLDRFDLDYYRPRGNPTKFIHALLQHFSRAKDEGILPEDYLRYAQGLRLSSDVEAGSGSISRREFVPDPISVDPISIMRAEEIANAYHVYQQLLLENEALDFGDLLAYVRELFITRPAVLERYRQQFRYVLVDEFQDTNWVQYEIVKLLAQPANNLTVVGDDDQCIFRWRGASYHNIIQFKNDFPKSAEVFLTRNYRSAQNILDCAYRFIQQNNPDRLECQLGSTLSKQLRAHYGTEGIIEHRHCETIDEEGAWVARTIVELKNGNPDCAWSDIAILVRANDTARPFIERLADAGVPYTVLSLKGLYAKPAILDILAYCTAVIHPHDSPAFWRVLSWPFRTFVPGTPIAISHYAHRMSISLYEACQKSDLVSDIPPDDRSAIKTLCAGLEKLNVVARTKRAAESFLTIVRDSGYLAYLKDGETDEKREALKYLDILYKKIRSLALDIPECRLTDVLEVIALEQEAGEQGSLPRADDESPDAVHILTCHSAKGLEFRHVFIVNMVDRRFPTTERHDAIELPTALLKEIVPQGDAHLEEERRLFYVALTRAKQGVYLTSCEDTGTSRKKKPSRFLQEVGVIKQAEEGQAKLVSTKLVSSPNFDRKFGLDTNFCTYPPAGKPPMSRYNLPSVFSYSQLAAFQKCPLQYKFAFVLKIPVFGKPALSFGRTLHLVLQRFFQSILDTASKNQLPLFTNPKEEYTERTVSIPPLETLFELYDEAWVDEWFSGKKQKEEYRAHGREILKRMHAELTANPPTPKALERDFTIKVGEKGEQYTIKGRIDRVDAREDGTVEIIDYKTGTPKETLTSEDKEQLVYYHIASEEVFGERPSKLTYYYLDNGTSVSFLGSDADKERLKVKAARAIATIKQSDFTATPGWHCKFCDFRDICEKRAY